ncbi:hypothetical protein LL037_07440 [Clostridium estertheticum]|uniref:hypothetical protein n=1 Tax=Clostridium estertheticum TaxID=238834 RepID=UPI001C0BA9A8|nr:hypothetical protein [Clostridium estertheticum]MBU3199948.1 hypothetical protein [Clostridium estertheticum]WAG66954.1 hypothetical protein LL037_07440 [Clostridium estertheticum]
MYKDDYIFPSFMYSSSFGMRVLTDATEIILSIDEIEKFNNNLKSTIPSLYNLDNEGNTMASEPLIDLIQSYKLFTKDMFDSNGKLIHTDYFEEIIRNTKYNNTHYMIHSFSGYSFKNLSNYETRSALQAAISSIDLMLASGTPFIQKFTSGVHYQ